MPLEHIRTLLNIVLAHNIFEFNGKMYKQVGGVAMGTRVAPTFANIYMAQVEQQCLQSLAECFPSPLLYKRYIDDIIIIWPASEALFKNFLNKLNNMHPTIKFISEYSSQAIHYLDLEIYKATRFARTNIFDLQPYYKPTNTFNYLHFSSAHPQHTHTALIKGKLVRLLRLSSSSKTFNEHALMLYHHILSRGYPKRKLRKIISNYTYTLRTYLTPQLTKKKGKTILI